MSQSDGDTSSDYESDVEIIHENDIVGLFTSQHFDTVASHYAHAKSSFGFDFYAIADQYDLDMYGKMRLINLIRKHSFASEDPKEKVREILAYIPSVLDELKSSESLLMPAIEGDRLIVALVAEDSDWSDDEYDDEDHNGESGGGQNETHNLNAAERQNKDADKKEDPIAELRAENKSLAIQNKRLVNQLEEVSDELKRVRNQYADIILAEGDDKTPESKVEAAASTVETQSASSFARHERNYFGSYSGMAIHDEMLRDKHRTESYRDAIMKNADRLFKDKVVLDVGCGTGILSMFAAKAGAKRVIGVDAADVIDTAREIVDMNGFGDVITLVKGMVEEISLPSDVQTVDVIVSEWMGYFLLYESMFSSVIFARDKWLRRASPANVSVFEAEQHPEKYNAAEIAALPFADDATLFPDVAKMFISPVEMRDFYQKKQDFWRSVYGFNMEPVLKKLSGELLPSSHVMIVCEDGSCRSGPSVLFKELNLMTATERDLDFTASLVLQITKKGPVEALCIHFDTIFQRACDHKVTLTTSLDAKATHWKQSVFQLTHIPFAAESDMIEVTIKANRAKISHRFYDVEVSYTHKEANPGTIVEFEQAERYNLPIGAQKAECGITYIQQYKLH